MRVGFEERKNIFTGSWNSQLLGNYVGNLGNHIFEQEPITAVQTKLLSTYALLINFFHYICYSVLFLEIKKEFGKAMILGLGPLPPPPPHSRLCDTGRNSTSLIRKQIIRNVKKQTKIYIMTSL